MKQFTPPALVAFVATAMMLFFLPQANAQTGPWDLLSDLLNQTGSGSNQGFLDNFDELGNEWNYDLTGSNDAFDELFGALGNNSPAGTLDDDYLDVWGPGLGLLSDGIPGLGQSLGSQDSILNTYADINGVFNSNADSLGGLFDQYQDSLKFDAENWEVVVIDGEELNDQQFDELSNSFDATFDLENPTSASDVLGSLFSAELFPDLELAFGTQEADLSYWGMDYKAKAKVIRVGSVPRFDQGTTMSQQFSLPIEARWHMQASFLSKDGIKQQGDGGLSKILDDYDGFSPLLFSGDFAVMATPIVGTLGNTQFRFITSLGLEVGTYAPAHKHFNEPYTQKNQGFTTGYGPQFGTGFSVSAGDLTIYSLATFSKGETLRSELGYEYNSGRFEAGMRYGNIINVRYSTGKASWQPKGNRTANVRNQVTVGIILNELHF